MFKNEKGEMTLHIDNRLEEITIGEPVVTEEQLKQVFKAYNLKETLLTLAELSKNIFNQSIPEPFTKIGTTTIQHPAGTFISQFTIEYLANIFLISGANDYKSESIKAKDNLLGLFNIYNNSVIHPRLIGNQLSSLLVPMYFEQIRGQAEIKDLLIRQWMIFSKVRKQVGNADFEDIDTTILDSTKLHIEEIIGLSFAIFSYLIHNPLFNIGNLDGHTVESFKNLITTEKVNWFLNLYSATYTEIRELDQKLNPEDRKEYTKTRFNPIWKKPILRLETNLFLAPSLTAYATASFYGLFWWFDDYYRNQSQKKQMEFRKYFGVLFENYVGEVLKDIYGETSVRKQIKYGSSGKEIDFIDWAVVQKDKIYLYEAKAYQFPLETLQKGDPDGVRKEVVNKIVYSIRQVYERMLDINIYEELSEFRGKNIVPIIVFYDIPFVSSSMYKDDISKALTDLYFKYSGIKDFKYNLIGISEVEDFYYCSDNIAIEDILEAIKGDPRKGFHSEVSNNFKDKTRRNFLDRNFDEYMDNLVPELQ